MSQEPKEPDSCTEATRHPFWMSGYVDNKLKDDRIIASGGFKVITYPGFHEVITQAVLELSKMSLSPIDKASLE